MATTTAPNHRCATRIVQSRRGAVIDVTGILDWTAVRKLQDAATSVSDASHVVIDLTGVESIDSAGVSALIAIFLREERAGAQLALVAAESDVAAVLAYVGISDVLPVLCDRQQAEGWLGHASGTHPSRPARKAY
jgi:anti-sigma B factor antagonist